MKRIGSVKDPLARAVVVGAAAALAMLLLAAPANAQSVADQYIPSPNPDGTQGLTAGPPGAAGTAAVAGTPAAAPQVTKPKSGSGSGSDIPYTGYPLTPAVDLILLLVVGGLVLRFVVPRLDRRHA